MLLSTVEASKILGTTKKTVILAAKRAGIEKIAGRFLFSEDQIPLLRENFQENKGCPMFVSGNDLWKRRKPLSEQNGK